MEHTRVASGLPVTAGVVGIGYVEAWSGMKWSSAAAQAKCYWWGMCERMLVHMCSGEDIHMDYDELAALWLLLRELTCLLIVDGSGIQVGSRG